MPTSCPAGCQSHGRRNEFHCSVSMATAECLLNCMSVCLSVCVSVRLSLSACLSACLSVCMPVFVLAYQSAACLSVCLIVCMYVCLHACHCAFTSVCLPVRVYLCLSFCLYLYFQLVKALVCGYRSSDKQNTDLMQMVVDNEWFRLYYWNVGFGRLVMPNSCSLLKDQLSCYTLA